MFLSVNRKGNRQNSYCEKKVISQKVLFIYVITIYLFMLLDDKGASPCRLTLVSRFVSTSFILDFRLSPCTEYSKLSLG